MNARIEYLHRVLDSLQREFAQELARDDCKSSILLEIREEIRQTKQFIENELAT